MRWRLKELEDEYIKLILLQEKVTKLWVGTSIVGFPQTDMEIPFLISGKTLCMGQRPEAMSSLFCAKLRTHIPTKHARTMGVAGYGCLARRKNHSIGLHMRHGRHAQKPANSPLEHERIYRKFCSPLQPYSKGKETELPLLLPIRLPTKLQLLRSAHTKPLPVVLGKQCAYPAVTTARMCTYRRYQHLRHLRRFSTS